MASAQLFVGNDNDVYLQGYLLAATGAPVTDALPAFTVHLLGGFDEDGNPIPGEAIPGLTSVSMPAVNAVPGDYRGLLSGTEGLTEGSEYYITVTFTNYNDFFEGWFTATTRST
jgi:hypothetical protein